MTYFKCVICQLQLYSASNLDHLVCDLCPSCGAMLEPVGELAELVGYRSIKSRDDSAEPVAGHGVLIGRFAEVLAGRRARSAEGAIDAERWLDDGGSFDVDRVRALTVAPSGVAPSLHASQRFAPGGRVVRRRPGAPGRP